MSFDLRRGAGVVELERLESVYTSKGYPGFESPSLRNPTVKTGQFLTDRSLFLKLIVSKPKFQPIVYEP